MRAMHQTLSVYKSDFICLCDIHDYVVNKAAKSSSPIIASGAKITGKHTSGHLSCVF